MESKEKMRQRFKSSPYYENLLRKEHENVHFKSHFDVTGDIGMNNEGQIVCLNHQLLMERWSWMVATEETGFGYRCPKSPVDIFDCCRSRIIDEIRPARFPWRLKIKIS